MVRLSLCMIVKDESAVLARCLESTRDLFDEIVILDTGSTDDTIEIARRFTPIVESYTWDNDFAAARNAAFARAGGEYIMWLDADDVLPIETVARLSELKARNFGGKAQIALKYCVAFDERGEPSFWYYRERIFSVESRPRWDGFIHECIPWTHDILLADCAVEHRREGCAHSERNLGIMRAHYREVLASPRLRYYYARELKDCGYAEKAVGEFVRSLADGLLSDADSMQACRELAQLYKQRGEHTKSRDYLLRALAYGVPSAELSCEIAAAFVEEERYRLAIYWYHQALLSPKDPYAFHLEEAHAFLPYVMLTVCYDRLGERDLARRYHGLAKQLKPNNKYVLWNEAYFNRLSAQSISATGERTDSIGGNVSPDV